AQSDYIRQRSQYRHNDGSLPGRRSHNKVQYEAAKQEHDNSSQHGSHMGQGLSNHIYYRVDDISGLHHHTDAGSKSHLHHTWNNSLCSVLKGFRDFIAVHSGQESGGNGDHQHHGRHHILSPVQGYGAPYEKSESTKGQNHDYKVNPSQLYIEIRMIDSLKTFHIRSVQQAFCFIFHNPAGVANGIDI